MAVAGVNSLNRRARALLTAFTALTALTVMAQAGWSIWQDRLLTIASEQQNGLVSVRLLEEHAHQELDAAAVRLDIVANGAAALIQKEAVSDAQIHGLIEATLKNSRSAEALQFVNVAGTPWVSLSDFPAYIIPAERRDYVAPLLQHPERKDLLLGRPFQRLIDGELVLPLARNLFDYNGRHLGLISTEIGIKYFNTVYQRAADSGGAVVQLVAEQGFVIARAPFDPRAANLDVGATALLHRMRAGPREGALNDYLPLDQTQLRLLSYRKVEGFPVIVAYGRTLDSVLFNWRQRAESHVLVSASFIVLQIALSYFLLLHMRRLDHADAMLRASEARFADLFQLAPIPLALIRMDTDQLIEANDAILGQFGFSRAEFIGHTPLDLHLWLNPEARKPYLEQLGREQAVERYEVQFRRKDGGVCTCLLSTRLIDAGGMRVGIFALNDVTHQRQVEQEIRDLNTELEQRVAQRTLKLEAALATVKSMQNELVRSEKMASLGALVAGIAHELNTPIGNCVTVVSTLLNHADSLVAEIAGERPRRSQLNQLGEATRVGVEILMRNLHRAAALLVSFKQLAGETSGDRRRQFDLKTAIEDIVMTLAPLYKDKHTMELVLAENLAMDSYSGALAQVISNFVSNALTHGFEHRRWGRMRIETRAGAGDTVELRFSDDGCGIPADKLDKVFDPFFTTKLGQGGSGLGMNIAYNLITGPLGGTVSLASVAGEGTTLTLILPRTAPEIGAAPA